MHGVMTYLWSVRTNSAVNRNLACVINHWSDSSYYLQTSKVIYNFFMINELLIWFKIIFFGARSLSSISLGMYVRNAGARCAGSRFLVSGYRYQVLGVQVSGANFKIPEICKILKLQEMILNNPLINIYVGNLQYPSLQISIFDF